MVKFDFRKTIISDLIIIAGVILVGSGIFLVFAEDSTAAYPSPAIYDIDSFDLTHRELEYKFEEKPEFVEVKIPRGATGLEVARILADKGLGESQEFLKYINLFRLESRIKAGEYTFAKKEGILNILSKIIIK
ncbi:aminodeoxychorismate lyase [Halothermothrix orenii]|uniref:Aminodeoxychorismate lyase n=1 Tax=Halothermothrix orenii (strain H 168 / OCM 544 / DSM 9562) TaxID=373903 RepID=B8CYP0_HALOH|nr:aminodeoxychorismate lyase [Halothermothrix orenii]ACL70409.1 Aminodeoxychorismate lyase [Halothermothrix orenii H 168]